MSRLFDDYCYERDRAWWIQQAEIERDSRQRTERESTQARATGAWGRECALVALRMLRRAGRLKAVTDDERKVVEWAERDPWLRMPGANRRLGSPFDEHYAVSADASAQAVLFDENTPIGVAPSAADAAVSHGEVAPAPLNQERAR